MQVLGHTYFTCFKRLLVLLRDFSAFFKIYLFRFIKLVFAELFVLFLCLILKFKDFYIFMNIKMIDKSKYAVIILQVGNDLLISYMSSLLYFGRTFFF